jgi:hypothetical protein
VDITAAYADSLDGLRLDRALKAGIARLLAPLEAP